MHCNLIAREGFTLELWCNIFILTLVVEHLLGLLLLLPSSFTILFSFLVIWYLRSTSFSKMGLHLVDEKWSDFHQLKKIVICIDNANFNRWIIFQSTLGLI